MNKKVFKTPSLTFEKMKVRLGVTAKSELFRVLLLIGFIPPSKLTSGKMAVKPGGIARGAPSGNAEGQAL